MLAQQNTTRDVKVAAIDFVIVHAQSIGDQQVVAALKLIDLGTSAPVIASATTEIKTIRDPEPGISFRTPPR